MIVFHRLTRLSNKRLELRELPKILSLKVIMPSELVKPQSLKSDTRLFKWAVIGVFVAGASYLALRQYRVVYCEEEGCDPRDPLDLFVDQIRSKIDLDLSLKDFKFDLQSKLDTFGSEFWDTVQDKIMDAKMKEALDFILAILENLKEFDMPDIQYNVPRLILLALVKRTQEYKVTKSDGRRREREERMLRKHWRKTEGGKRGEVAAAVVAALECRCRNTGAAPWIRPVHYPVPA